MITFPFPMTVKAGREGGWHEVLSRLCHSTNAEDTRCITSDFHRRAGDVLDKKLYALAVARDGTDEAVSECRGWV